MLLASPEQFGPAFIGNNGVCVSLCGNVGLCLALGTGDHIPQVADQAALHSDGRGGIGKLCDQSELGKPIPNPLTA